MPSLQHKRGTLAQINAAATANGLKPGEMYLVTDQGRMTVATAANAHVPIAKQSEAGGGAVDETDPTLPQVRVDDFLSQSTETGEVGGLNWTFTGGSVVNSLNVQNHTGIQRRTSATTANSVSSIYMGGAATTTIMRFDEFDICRWIFKLVATGYTDTIFRFGVFDQLFNSAQAHGVYLEKLPADTNWFFVARNNSVETRVDTGVATNSTNWVNFFCQRVSASLVEFSINGGAKVQVTANIPDAADSLNPGFLMVPTGTTARSVDMDYFALKTVGVTR